MIAKGFVLLLAGIPVYVLVRWRQAREKRTSTHAVSGRTADGAVAD